jgi:hypothetical protein
MEINNYKVDTGTIEKWIMVFVLVLVLFQVIAEIFPDVLTSASSLNSAGFPLAEFFTSGGVLWFLVAAGLLFMVYKSFVGNSRK